MCVYAVCVHCGQLEPAVPPEKTALNFVENSANAGQNAKKISGAAQRRLTAVRREKKLRFLEAQKVRSRDFDIFSRKKPDGKSFM